MAINFKGKTSCIFGLRGTGKSTFRDFLFNQFGELGILYDTLHETPENSSYTIYRPDDRYSVFELCNVVRQVIGIKEKAKNNNNVRAYDYIGIEECNRFVLPKPHPLPPEITDLNDMCRNDVGHYGIGVFYICRRPTQLHQDLIELSDYIFIFRLVGNNDVKYLNNIADGLGDTAKQLPDYHFIQVNPDRSYEIKNPIPPASIWLNKNKRNED
jgi:hypothetical protein